MAILQEMLGRLALACRDHERVRFHDRAADGEETDRLIEPYAVVSTRRTRVLVCWDLRRDDWRTFRLDRLSRLVATRVHFPSRELLSPEAAELIRSAGRGTKHSVVIVLSMPLAEMVEVFGQCASGAEDADQRRTGWPVESESVAGLLSALVWIPVGAE